MVKVFLSHQSADSALAAGIARRLWDVHRIDCYLDVIDPHIGRFGEDIARHIRLLMGSCTQLLAIVSNQTTTSQWVPWEIGVATEKDYPLATFSVGAAPPPEFLRKWPVLRTDPDLDAYATASKRAETRRITKASIATESLARRDSTADFYKDLRTALGQL